MKIFLSYRRSDSQTWTRRLYELLCRQLGGGTVFLDTERIELGETWRDALRLALEECDILFVIIGPSWLSASDEQNRRRLDLETDVVRQEIEEALGRNLRIVPLLMPGAAMPDSRYLPDELKALTDFQAFTFTEAEDLAPQVQRLLQGILHPRLDPFQEGSPELETVVSWWSCLVDPFRSAPPEQLLLRRYLGCFARHMDELNGQLRDEDSERFREEETGHHYVPMEAESLGRAPGYAGGYQARPSRPEMLTRIRREVRQIPGYHLGGDGATAQLAGRGGNDRVIKDVARLLSRADQPLILLGDPGSGKSMTLREAGRKLAQRGLDERRPALVVYVRLGDYRSVRNGQPGSIWQLIRESIDPRRFPGLRGLLPYLVEQRRLIVLFDGMDEMERDRYGERVECLSRFACEYAGRIRTLFACRTNDFSPRFTHRRLVLLDFDRPQVAEFLTHNLHGWPLQIGDQRFQPDSLADRLLESSTWGEVARNPMTLNLLCNYLRGQSAGPREWPRNRAALFEAYLRSVLNAPTRDPYTEADWPRLQAGWARLAHAMTTDRGGTSFSWKNLGSPPPEFCIAEGLRCGLLLRTETDEEAVRFNHHRLQEYLTAWHLANQAGEGTAPDWNALIDTPRWQETLIHLVSLQQEECPALRIVEESLQEVRSLSSSRPRDAAEERRLADRVVLASRVLRELGDGSGNLPQSFVRRVRESIEYLAQTGKPTTQVRMLWAWHNAGVCPLSSIERPLSSDIGWVREQAVKVASEQPVDRAGDRLDLQRLMAQDLATGRILERAPAYRKAIRASGDPSLRGSLAWAIWARRLYEGGMVALLYLSLWSVFAYHPQLAAHMGPLRNLDSGWLSAIFSGVILLAAFALRDFTAGEKGGEKLPFWTWVTLLGAFSLALLYLSGSLMVPANTEYLVWKLVGTFLAFLATTQVLYWGTLTGFLLCHSGSPQHSADKLVWEFALRTSQVQLLGFGGGYCSVWVLGLYALAYYFPTSSESSAVGTFFAWLFGIQMIVLVGGIFIASIASVIEGWMKGRFWITLLVVIACWVLIPAFLGLVIYSVILIGSAFYAGSEAEISLEYVLGWNILFGLVLVGLWELLWLSSRRLLHRPAPSLAGGLTLNRWREQIVNGNADEQVSLLHVDPRSLRLTTAQFLQVLEELEAHIKPDPAMSVYCQLLFQVQETIRQESRATPTGQESTTTEHDSATNPLYVAKFTPSVLSWLGPWIRRVALFLLVSCGGIAAWSYSASGQHPVFVVNGLPNEDLLVILDELDPFTLSPQQVREFRVPEGAHLVRYQRANGNWKEIPFTIAFDFVERLSTRKVWIVNPEGAAILRSATSFVRSEEAAKNRQPWAISGGGYYFARELHVHKLHNRMFLPLPSPELEGDYLGKPSFGYAPDLPGWVLEQLPELFTPRLRLELAEKYLRESPDSDGLLDTYVDLAIELDEANRCRAFIIREMQRLKLSNRITDYRSIDWHLHWKRITHSLDGIDSVLAEFGSQHRKDPSNPLWMFLLALSEPSTSRALKYCDQSLEILPDNNYCWDKKCKLLLEQGQLPLARTMATQGREKYDWDVDYLFYLLRLDLAESRVDDATRRLEEIRVHNKAQESPRAWAVALAGLQNDEETVRSRTNQYLSYCEEQKRIYPCQPSFWQSCRVLAQVPAHHALREFKEAQEALASLPPHEGRWWRAMLQLERNEPVEVHYDSPSFLPLLAALGAVSRGQPQPNDLLRKACSLMRKHYPVVVDLLESETAPDTEAVLDLNIEAWQRAAVFLALAQRFSNRRAEWLDEASRFAYTPFAPGHFLRRVIGEEKARGR